MRIHYYELRNECPHCELPNTVYEDRVTCPKCIELISEHKEKEEPMPAKKFYMVIIDTTPYPRPRHETFEEAKAYAEKLLSSPENKGKEAHILKSIAHGKSVRAPATWSISWLVGKLD